MRSPMFGSAIWLALAATSVAQSQYGYNQLPVRQDSELIAANFPDVDVELRAPAFLEPGSIPSGFANGTEPATSHKDMESFMQSLADKHEWMTYNVLNFTSEEGRSFPYVHLSSSASTATDKVRVWYQGSVHGNEPAGDQAALAFLGKLDANTTYAASLLDRLEIIVLPRYNPDGNYYFQRTLATNYDPNRDHVKLARTQTRQIKEIFSKFSPHISIDAHEYGAPTRYLNYVPASDGLYSAAKNLNIHPLIRNMSESVFAPAIGAHMESLGLRWEPYVTGSASNGVINFAEAGTDAKIGRNNMGLSQAITFLTETRGIYLADQQFQRRTVASLAMAEAIIDTAAEKAAEVLEAVEGGREDFIKSNAPVVITDFSDVIDRPFKLIDINNGSVVQVPVRFASTTPANANLTRARPEAYLIPPAWADLAERMRVAGLEVATLSDGYAGAAEALTITSTTIARSYYEGVIRVTATTNTTTKDIKLPPGTFSVSTRQKNAALAMVALEPENIDSYVSFNIVPAEVGPIDFHPATPTLAMLGIVGNLGRRAMKPPYVAALGTNRGLPL
ncbi:hypothetical protein MCOR04_009842 [Pyricularia oryzae]|nr:hypothetical protein MCOR04_009842 [Pyricularia oryzae]